MNFSNSLINFFANGYAFFVYGALLLLAALAFNLWMNKKDSEEK